jgi:hypothetical protein
MARGGGRPSLQAWPPSRRRGTGRRPGVGQCAAAAAADAGLPPERTRQAAAQLRFAAIRSWHPLEEISRLAGHSRTAVTELVYRKQIRPVVQTGAIAMNDIFGQAARPVPAGDSHADSHSLPASPASDRVDQRPGMMWSGWPDSNRRPLAPKLDPTTSPGRSRGLQLAR